MTRNFVRAAACAVALFAAGCAHIETQTSKTSTISWTAPTKRVLIVEPDVQLGELSAGGAVTWRADWSKTGKEFVEDDIRGTLSGRGIEVADSGALTDPHHVQLVKLHDVVGGAIIFHVVVGGANKLPTKSDPLDYTLGPGVMDLRNKFGADYALFVDVRDTYSSSSRKALQVFAAIAGVGIQGGTQAGYVSLVDLKTGNIVWFNFLTDQYGDLRDAKGAQSTVANLMKGLPL